LARFHLRGATIPGVLGWGTITFWQCLSLIAGASARRVEYGLDTALLLLTTLPSTTARTHTHTYLLLPTLLSTTLLGLELCEPLWITQKRIRS
tara:strand:+ start:739 stop:1017 length:279 start_codon:yes stop_codon:yes gene_type:complete